MSNSSRLQNRVPWRKVCAALPAFALIGGGIGLTTQGTIARDILGFAISKGSPAIVVPDIALTLPGRIGIPVEPPLAGPDASAPQAPAPQAPAPEAPGGSTPGSSSPGTLDSTGIPVQALEAYRGAVSLVDSADPDCHVDWALLAAIGRVESDHARFGGNQLDSAGVAQPGIIGIPLDGSNGTARITDSDGGLLDQDSIYDRAVGPMQFIPSTWRIVGADADGDGVKNPQDMADAATATGIYLCSGPGDLRRPGDLHGAIMRYNASEEYVQMVTSLADSYRSGVAALPAYELVPASPSLSAAEAMLRPATPTPALPSPARPTPALPTPALPIATALTPPGTVTALPAPTRPAAPAPATPTKPSPVTPTQQTPPPATATQPTQPTPPPATATPAKPTQPTPPPVTATPVTPAQPTPPVTPVPVTPPPCTPEPAVSDPAVPAPAVPAPALPAPCLPPCLPTATPITAPPTPTQPAQATPCVTPAVVTLPSTTTPTGSTPTPTA